MKDRDQPNESRAIEDIWPLFALASWLDPSNLTARARLTTPLPVSSCMQDVVLSRQRRRSRACGSIGSSVATEPAVLQD